MNIEFLKSLEKVKSDDFDRSHKTQSELDDKARNLSAAFTVFFTATIGYSLDSFPTASMLQQIFLLSLVPAYLASIWLFKEALASREYIEGMTIKLPLADISEEEYLKKRIKFLNTSFNKNCDSNNTKSKALTGGITMFLASFFIASLCSVFAVFFYHFTAKIIIVYVVTLIISVLLTIIAAHFFAPSLRIIRK